MANADKQRILEELGGISEEVYDDLVRECVSFIQKSLVEIGDALKKDDLSSAARIAHTLKGTCANLRMNLISSAAEVLHDSCRGAASKDKIQEGLKDLKEVFRQYERGESV